MSEIYSVKSKIITRLDKTGKPGSKITENHTILVILRGEKVNQAEFRCVKRMLFDTGNILQ